MTVHPRPRPLHVAAQAGRTVFRRGVGALTVREQSTGTTGHGDPFCPPSYREEVPGAGNAIELALASVIERDA